MTRINDKNGQLNRWLARIFPPSSPQYAQPSELNDTINLVSAVLPASLLYERVGLQFGTTVNPATQLFFPSVEGGNEGFGATQAGVPNGKFYYIIAARWSVTTAVGANVGKCFIAVKNIASTNELGFAAGEFTSNPASFSTEFLDTRSIMPQIPVTLGPIIGSGCLSPIVLPPGWNLHMSTTQTPAATTTYTGVVMYVVCDIGELHP